jgi:hypothetical protein
MPRTITIPDELLNEIHEFQAEDRRLSDLESSGPPYPAPEEWQCNDDEARAILGKITQLPSIEETAESPAQRRVDGAADEHSTEIIVEEITNHTLHLHPDRFPTDYDLDADTAGLFAAAIADATSCNLGTVTVTERETISGARQATE